MNTLWTKNTVIALMATNIAFASYIVKDKALKHFRGASFHASHDGGIVSPNSHRHGIVEPVYFKNSNELQTCYESLLRRQPARDEGSVSVNMVVTGDGEIHRLNLVHNDFDEPVFTQCVLEKIKATRLPASEDKSEFMIAHKFNFHRKTASRIDFEK